MLLSKCVTGRNIKQSMADNRPLKPKQLVQFEIFSMNEHGHHMQNRYKQLKCGRNGKLFCSGQKPGKDALSRCPYGSPH